MTHEQLQIAYRNAEQKMNEENSSWEMACLEQPQDQVKDLWNRFTSENGILGDLDFRSDVLNVITHSKVLASGKKGMTAPYTDEYIKAYNGVQEAFDVLILRMKALEEMQKKTEPTVSKTDTLERCPICGNLADIYAKQGRSKGWYDVGCSRFGCIAMRESFRSPEDAMEAWNRRVKE